MQYALKFPIAYNVPSVGSQTVPFTFFQDSAKDQFRYTLRSRGGRWENREPSASVTATSPASKVRHPSQLLPEHRHVHLVEVKYCEDTRPKNQLEASKQQHRNLCHRLSRALA
eukprot:1161191-Pelagomonas_calceolata.AAC.7